MTEIMENKLTQQTLAYVFVSASYQDLTQGLFYTEDLCKGGVRAKTRLLLDVC